MNELAAIGRKRTILISISLLMVSLHTIYFYQVSVPEFESKKLIQQIIRFILTIGLLLAVYQGKHWAKNASIVLFSLGIIGAIYGLTKFESLSINMTPFFVMIFVFGMAVHHFGLSKSFKAFQHFQNSKDLNPPIKE
ncbi:hypothetical protein V8V91_15755 [Algoriphagus halophilus]|uniref:hypothetical protein n=1 Tax=Algoriphagus halophilus TaxID=226505 RepID=UPI00358F2481